MINQNCLDTSMCRPLTGAAGPYLLITSATQRQHGIYIYTSVRENVRQLKKT